MTDRHVPISVTDGTRLHVRRAAQRAAVERSGSREEPRGRVGYRRGANGRFYVLPEGQRVQLMPFEVIGSDQVAFDFGNLRCSLRRASPRARPFPAPMADSSLVNYCAPGGADSDCSVSELQQPAAQCNPLGEILTLAEVHQKVRGCEAGSVRIQADGSATFVRSPPGPRRPDCFRRTPRERV